MARKKQRPELTLGGPHTSSPLELAYCIMREAEACQPGEEGRFKAMDCHTWILDLADEHRGVHEAVHTLGLGERIGLNQDRLGIW